jgi:aldose 1-epimerase
MKDGIGLSLLFSLGVSCMAANLPESKASSPHVTKRAFGVDATGEAIDEYTLTNAHGVTARVITYGATLRELLVPDLKGKSENVILGFDNLAQYEETKNRHYFGATVGRYANRIAGAKFSLDGKEYKLAANNGPNTLHGGIKGFDRHCWKATPVKSSKEPAVKFSYVSDDMEEGFPGKVDVSVTYTLTDDDSLRLDYTATTDKATPINLTNHVYFNLDGAGNGTILNHRLKIDADEYLPVDKVLIPTGKPAAVKGTPFDFTKAKEIGAELKDVPGGYDHNWNLRYKDGKLIEALTAYGAQSGRVLTMYTTEPGVQIYIGQGQDGTLKGNGGVYQKYCGFTLEAQKFPDSPHHPEYPNAILRPGQEYKQTTLYKFAAAK